MVIEIAEDDSAVQRRRSDAVVPVEPTIRRMRWGSFKSRSYDHAGDRHRQATLPPNSFPQNYGRTGPTVMPGAPLYSSLERREYSLPPYSRQYERHAEPTYPTSRSYGISAGRSYAPVHSYPSSSRDYPKREPQQPYDQGGPSGYDYEATAGRDYRRAISDEYSGRDPYHYEYSADTKEPRDYKDERDYRYDHPPYEEERYPMTSQRPTLRRDYQRYPDQNQWNSNLPPEQYEPQMMQPGQAIAGSSRYGQQSMMPPEDR